MKNWNININNPNYKWILSIEFIYNNETFIIYNYRYWHAYELNPKKCIEYIDSFPNKTIPSTYIETFHQHPVWFPKNGDVFGWSILIYWDDYCDLSADYVIDPQFVSSELIALTNKIKWL